MNAAENGITPVNCLDDECTCVIQDHCISHDAWKTVLDAIKGALSAISLENLVTIWKSDHSIGDVVSIIKGVGCPTLIKQ